MIDVNAHQMLAEHARGDSYRLLGERHGVSHEHVRQTVLRQGTAFANEVELSLLLAWKFEQLGRDSEAEWPGLVIPHQPGDGWQLGLSLVQWLTDEMKRRGLRVHVRNRPTPEGLALFLILEDL